MRTTRGGGPGPDTGVGPEMVIAAQQGDRAAMDALLAEYLPLLYNIVGRALNGHADTDDVVQETMLRAVRGLPDLRDPAAFRSWLVAVAVRQVRDHLAARAVLAARDPAAEVADPRADFVNLTILQLGLSGQRRETAEATRWLDREDQDVLALWWQEAAGTLGRGDVVSGLGMSPAHAAVRIGRMKERLTTARLVVRALSATPPCPALAEVTAGWDHAPSPLWRKRLARHVRNCPRCGAQLTDLVPAERLLNGLPVLPVPPLLALAAALARPVLPAGPAPAAPGHAAPAPAAPGHAAPGHAAPGHAAPGQHAGGARRLGALHHLRTLPKAAALLQPKVVAATIAAGCVAAGAIVAVHAHHASPPPPPAAHALPGPSLAARQPRPHPASAAPARRPRRTRARPPAAPVAGSLKGVGAWAFTGASQALAQSGAAWYYTWSTTHQGIVSPPGVAFVPMIWGSGSVTTAALDQARSESHVLLGFNEPDLSSQANMTVQQALDLWPRLMATGLELGSPAVADHVTTPGGWLDQFMRGAAARGYRVNFIAVHWYGADFATRAAVSQLRSFLEAVHARYHLPIWITELGLVSYAGPAPSFPTDRQQAAFLTAAAPMLARLGYVPRYAWFALPVSSGDGNMGLFSSGPAVTPLGRAFEAVARR